MALMLWLVCDRCRARIFPEQPVHNVTRHEAGSGVAPTLFHLCPTCTKEFTRFMEGTRHDA
jgi:hypothetical protein